MMRPRKELTCLITLITAPVCMLSGRELVLAQSSLSVASQRPFVVGVVPVVSGGAVGGVAIDASGIIGEAEPRNVASLRDARLAATDGVVSDVNQPSKLRKVSLRRLDELLALHAAKNKPLPSEVLHLAGLQRVEYLFAYPDSNDIVLAGPAEGWTIDNAGNAVGINTGAAVMQLVDLIAALRSTDQLLAGEIISCSIDPTAEGLQRFSRLIRGGRVSASPQSLRRMEQAVGLQTITLTGVAADSHFAQVLVAADWQMKRIGMGLVDSPVEDLPSYLQLLEKNPNATPRNALPRWWIAFGPQPVERDPQGLGWRLSPPGVEVRTAAATLDADGQIAADAESDPIAKQWADAMTSHFDELGIAQPVFNQLRGCMDLALVTAVLASGDLLTHVGLELPMLLEDARLQGAAYPVPRRVDSRASALRRSRGWIVTVSGGVELDVTRAVNGAQVHAQIEQRRTAARPSKPDSWWWD